MNSEVSFSETESAILGYRFGRCNTDNINADELKHSILKGKFDIVRLRTSSNDEFAANKLEAIGFPYFFSGGVRRYKVDCYKAPDLPFTDANINFELFTGQHKDKLEYIMKDTWGNYPLGYYKSPVLNNIFDKDIESKALFEFYAKMNNNANYPNNYLWFMKLGEEYIGFVALYVYREQNMIDSTIAGVLKVHQSKGLFPNILRHVRHFCVSNKLQYFCCGARNENLYSQWAFERDYMRGIGVEYVYHLIPFLSAGSEIARTKYNPNKSTAQQLFDLAGNMGTWHPQQMRIVSGSPIAENSEVALYQVNTSREKLLIARIFNPGADDIAGAGYLLG